jgi:hypothetical protein
MVCFIVLPGGKISFIPNRFKLGISVSGITPPAKIGISDVPSFSNRRITSANSSLCAPERQESPIKSRSLPYPHHEVLGR